MKIRYSIEDLTECFNFSIRYHLAENKSNYNRTTGQNRGLGSIINDFFYGKLVEIGVVKAIESYNSNIKCILDFDIHPLNSSNISDPDIIKISESTSIRNPNLFVEIKYHSKNDRWLGLTAEQFRTIKENDNFKDFYIIYASLNCESDLNDDLLGIYLRNFINNDYLNKFSKLESIYLKIDRILPSSILEEKGIEFNLGRLLLETEIFQEIQEKSAFQLINKSHRLETTGKNLPVIMADKRDPVEEYGEYHINGMYELWLKSNLASSRYLIHPITNCKVTSAVLGNFNLEAGKYYLIWFCPVGRDPILKRNNIWIANRNVHNLVPEPTEKLLERISREI